jgi:hypothetical protein
MLVNAVLPRKTIPAGMVAMPCKKKEMQGEKGSRALHAAGSQAYKERHCFTLERRGRKAKRCVTVKLFFRIP